MKTDDGVDKSPTEITEKTRRIYYQDIVYKICGLLDDFKGNHISRGTGLVCGTAEEPSSEVQDALRAVLRSVKETQ